MSRRKLITGNWKMNATLEEAVKLTRQIVAAAKTFTDVDVVLCPAFTTLSLVRELIHGTPIALGAQNVYPESSGAFTGEISPVMLKDVGCTYSIIGHSERRHLMGETDLMVQKKLQVLLQNGLKTILCVGETLSEREGNQTWKIVENQLVQALEGVGASAVSQEVVIAYEPVWAIGTGKNATAAQAQEIHGLIRKWLIQCFQEQAAQSVRILYGGSVKPENAGELMSQPDVDGALVGGASLQASSFLGIIQAAQQKIDKGERCCTG